MNNHSKFNFDNVSPRTISVNTTKKVRIKSHSTVLRSGNLQGVIERGKNIIFFIFLSINFIFLVIILNLLKGTVNAHNTSEKKKIEIITKKNRGQILDREGNIISASILLKDLYLDSKKIIDKKNTEERLKIIFPKKHADFFKNIFKKNEYKLIKKHLSKETEFEIKKIGEPGLIFQNSVKRVYPQNNLFSQSTGFMSRHGSPQSKLEKNLDKHLSNGENITLTLNLQVQNIIYQEIKKSMLKFNSKGAGAVLINVNDGEILSLVSLPDFDPNHPSLIKPFTENNLITTSRFEMGSTLKIFNAAMAYENNSINDKELFDVSNNYQLTKRHIIKDDFLSKEPINFETIFTKSSNIGSIQVLEKVGIEKQQIFLEKLGFKSSTNIKGLSTLENSLPDNWNKEISKSISFGYGISMTPINLVKSFSVLVNGGYEIYPNIILEEKKRKEINRILDLKTSIKINKLLEKIVIEGTGKNAKVNGLNVGGKTGTAKKSHNGDYSKDKIVTSFIGAFPISKPEYLLFIIYDEPKDLKKINKFYGGNTAAPIFSNIVKKIAPILKIKTNSIKKKIIF